MAKRKQNPKIPRGEIWLIDFDYPDPHDPPGLSKGSEPQKRRPAVVMNIQTIGRLPLHIVVPLTTGQEHFVTYPWMVHIAASNINKLNHDSWADAFQVTSTSTKRFIRRLGKLEENLLDEIVNAIRICVESE